MESEWETGCRRDRRKCFLNAPDITTLRGLRDRAIIAVLLGCGLRRSEVAALTLAHIQQRDGRWCIVDLMGKHGRIRTTPMPNWGKVAIDSWTSAANVAAGQVFRPVIRGDRVSGERLGEKVVWQILREYAAEIGIPGLAPHDLARARNCVEQPAANWNKSKCYWDTPLYRYLGTKLKGHDAAMRLLTCLKCL